MAKMDWEGARAREVGRASPEDVLLPYQKKAVDFSLTYAKYANDQKKKGKRPCRPWSGSSK